MTSAIDDHIVDAALQLLVVLLHEGHRATQQAFFHYVTHSSEEEFFIQVKDRLSISMANIKEARLLASTKAAQKKQERLV